MHLTALEIETVRALIRDHGFEYSLQTKTADLVALARRLSAKTDWDDLTTVPADDLNPEFV